MKYDYRTLEYYQYWYHRLEKKKNFLNAYIEHVNTIMNGGRCCFACSFLCCCCCSRIGRDALVTCDFSRHWINSLQKIYKNQSGEKVKKIMKDAIVVLEKTRKHVYNHENIQKNKNYIDWINNHQDNTHYKIPEYYNDAWIHRIFKSLHIMTNIPIEQHYSLSVSDVDKLLVAMPLFYPVLFSSEDYSYPIKDDTIETIQKMIT